MKEVKVTKSPTLLQMLNMASNLKEKFFVPSNISITAWHFSGDSPDSNKCLYRLYVESIHSLYPESWEELQNTYFRIMKGEL